MKPIIIIAVALILRVLGCEKEAAVEPSNVIKGKVVHSSCASVVVQVLDPQHYNIAQAEWKQAPNKPTYQNVFTVKNRCSVPAMEAGSEFNFELIDSDPKEADCVVCAMWDNPPAKVNRIKIIK